MWIGSEYGLIKSSICKIAISLNKRNIKSFILTELKMDKV